MPTVKVTRTGVQEIVRLPRVTYATPVVLPFGTFTSAEAVPTCVRVGADGHFYVGLLTGFPYRKGSASVLKVDANTHAVSTYATGFTNIMDLAFDPANGRLYVLELSSEGLLPVGPNALIGAIVRVDGPGSIHRVVSGLVMPGGLTIRRGHFYVSNCGAFPGGLIGPNLRRARRGAPIPPLVLNTQCQTGLFVLARLYINTIDTYITGMHESVYMSVFVSAVYVCVYARVIINLELYTLYIHNDFEYIFNSLWPVINMM